MWNHNGIESKAQLKSHRIDKWRGECVRRGLWLDNSHAWADSERAASDAAWAVADADYEARKLALLAQLQELSADDLAAYFVGIGVDPVDPAKWLAPSPVLGPQ